MSKSRRKKFSNRRLPNFTSTTSTQATTLNQLRSILGYGRQPLEDFKSLLRQPRQLAKNINKPQQRSKLLKTFDGSTLTSNKASQPVDRAPTLKQLREAVCVSRMERGEILHALKKNRQSRSKKTVTNLEI
jgi:hypothetical protein